MEGPEFIIFSNLYREAYLRCFNQPFSNPINETESKLFYQQILECTGLTIGWRSLKNYSFFVTDNNREENPSVASMDTLARYVLKAPYTNEIVRKKEEGHHPYWFMYRNKQLGQANTTGQTTGNKRWYAPLAGVAIVLIIFALWYHRERKMSVNESFTDLSEPYLTKAGWFVLDKDNTYWAKRMQESGSLTLFTLEGDNWPDGSNEPVIKNMLVHALPDGCFTIGLQMQNFIPAAEWQQAGLLLLEDTTLNSPSIRVSLAYNDMFGGYNKPKEVIVQAIASPGYNSTPEEFAHLPVLALDSITFKPALVNNLKYNALRIERNNKRYRFLYANGNTPNGAFKEVAVKDVSFTPHYIAIFAIKGRVAATQVAPVNIKRFVLQSAVCE
jgi:hypothetical protein